MNGKEKARQLLGVMPRLPAEARGDFLFYEFIRDMIRLGVPVTEEEAKEQWEAWKKR